MLKRRCSQYWHLIFLPKTAGAANLRPATISTLPSLRVRDTYVSEKSRRKKKRLSLCGDGKHRVIFICTRYKPSIMHCNARYGRNRISFSCPRPRSTYYLLAPALQKCATFQTTGIAILTVLYCTALVVTRKKNSDSLLRCHN